VIPVWPFGVIPPRPSIAYSLFFNLSPVAIIIVILFGILLGLFIERIFPSFSLSPLQCGLSVFIYTSSLNFILAVLNLIIFTSSDTLIERLLSSLPCAALGLGVYVGASIYRKQHPEIQQALDQIFYPFKKDDNSGEDNGWP